jgi:hypothetical protein
MPTPKVNSWLGWRNFTVNNGVAAQHLRRRPPMSVSGSLQAWAWPRRWGVLGHSPLTVIPCTRSPRHEGRFTGNQGTTWHTSHGVTVCIARIRAAQFGGHPWSDGGGTLPSGSTARSQSWHRGKETVQREARLGFGSRWVGDVVVPGLTKKAGPVDVHCGALLCALPRLPLRRGWLLPLPWRRIRLPADANGLWSWRTGGVTGTASLPRSSTPPPLSHLVLEKQPMCIPICMPGSSFIHIVDISEYNNGIT